MNRAIAKSLFVKCIRLVDLNFPRDAHLFQQISHLNCDFIKNGGLYVADICMDKESGMLLILREGAPYRTYAEIFALSMHPGMNAMIVRSFWTALIPNHVECDLSEDQPLSETPTRSPFENLFQIFSPITRSFKIKIFAMSLFPLHVKSST